jgi:hypothetical protein
MSVTDVLHTPGPWRVILDTVRDGDISVLSDGLQAVALIDCREHPDDTEDVPREAALANARLIAASPELLAVVKEYLEWGAMTGSDRDLFDERFRAAIAKAEGRSHD